MKKILLAGVAAAAVWAGCAVANPGYGYGPGPGGYYTPPAPYQHRGAEPAAESPGTVLRRGMDALLAFLEQTPEFDRLKIAAFLESEISPFFDFAYMAQVAAGPMIRDMDEEQRLKLEGKLKELFLTALAERLGSYDQQRVVYLPPRRTRGKIVTLSIAIEGAGPYPAQIDFRLHQTGGEWKVFDVSANGSSALAYYRDYFRRASMPRPPMGSAGPGPYGGMYR